MTIGLVGCGLIGGSIGLACRANGHHVTGVDSNPGSSKIALERGCVDVIGELKEVAQSEIIFICVPPKATASLAEDVIALKSPESIISDCTSIKGPVVSWLKEHPNNRFIPGHPMAGHEKSGPKFASAWMFRGAKWILCPLKSTDKSALKKLEALISEMGATPIRIDAQTHDRDVAYLSHLPHAIAASLVRLGARLDSVEASAGSWKDLTRVGGVDPELWTQICMENRVELCAAMAEMQKEWSLLSDALAANDESAVRKFFVEAQSAKGESK
ncbi:MAG TPA: prephenate dehydrogenase/arogenate dehydrogenase family protein [Fimbriimonadaceae bacterium]|nr:prephenate dehydrogenase/arogenate dehydrogenase family protein [Fimbriimonadaceae bacterium]